ncbi:MAG: hypothetical protein OEW69_05570 [Nitrospirota bacterium]|nr:hypothetical protein [Nitrospirota bacterium]
MELCKGLENWFECLNCPHLCTKMCPIEDENVMEAIKIRIRLLSVSEIAKDSGFDQQ